MWRLWCSLRGRSQLAPAPRGAKGKCIVTGGALSSAAQRDEVGVYLRDEKNFRMFEGMVVERGLVLEYIADSPSRIAYLREEIESKIFFFILRVTYFPQVKPAKSEANQPTNAKQKKKIGNLLNNFTASIAAVVGGLREGDMRSDRLATNLPSSGGTSAKGPYPGLSSLPFNKIRYISGHQYIGRVIPQTVNREQDFADAMYNDLYQEWQVLQPIPKTQSKDNIRNDYSRVKSLIKNKTLWAPCIMTFSRVESDRFGHSKTQSK
ncbi:hypothetical protein CEXT_586431 [Caerostris extrusa]|uniref:Uncharacterized protein n=1 Tax=Caerostris extrusa TaxID=172846 RepID=A0AAV4RBI1_CAEEX|nr:hypothetical protein CEXT_586431 [Caerostris extrusa]